MQKIVNIKNDCRSELNEDIIATILESRGIKNVDHFLNPTEDDILPLDSMYRIDEAGQIVCDGIKENKKFFVNVDSDTDGVCSGSIIIRYLKGLGCEVDWHVSAGKTHGTSDKLLEKLKKSKADILIIVDSLDGNVENYKKIKEMGIQTIVLDHHIVSELIPYDEYVVLVSSNRNYENSELSGSGVVWKFAKYLDSILGISDADNLVDLAGCGIVSDMMDMSESHMENRAIVSMALSNLQSPAMKKVIGNYDYNSNSFSYSVAPLINASCRYNENEAAVNAFLADDNKDVLKYLRVLKGCKEKQTEEMAEILPDIMKQADEQIDRKLIVVVIETDSGVSGLLANQLLNRYNRPIMVLKEGYSGYSGSCRSIGCGNFKEICDETGLGDFAGHEEAFGVVNIYYNNFDAFREVIEEKLAEIEPKTEIDVDVELDLGDINRDLVEKIKQLDKVSGQGFKAIKGFVKIDDYEAGTMSKGKHLVVSPNSWFKFIKWNSGESMLEEMEDHAMFNDELGFVGTFDMGFLGREFSIRMIVDDIIAD